MNGHAGLVGDHLPEDMHERWIGNGVRSASGKLHMGSNHIDVENDLLDGKKQGIASQVDSNGTLFDSEGLKPNSESGAPISKFKELSLDGLMDGFLDDSRNRGEEPSTSARTNLPPPGSSIPVAPRAKLKSQVSQKLVRVKSEIRTKSRSDSFRPLVAGDENEFDIIELGFETNAQAREYFSKQSSEFTRYMGMVKLENHEELVISSCQRLVFILREFPNQKSRLISRHGLIPLMDMLETSSHRVLHQVLRLLNHVIQDNSDLQENACLIGLIPLVTKFASTEYARDIRMEVGYFVRQLCQTSATTLQMFIACRGLPVLVGFLEPDYANYREMVHMAIDAMWQVFELHGPTSKNDFCRLFAKSAVLVRLVNTLHNLNEAARAGLQAGAPTATTITSENPQVLNPLNKLSGPLERLNIKSQSGPLESHSRVNIVETFRPFSGQLDASKVTRAIHTEATGPHDIEMSRLQPGQPHKSTGLPDYLRYLPGQVEQPTRAHSGHFEQPKAAAVDYWRQPAATTNPFLHHYDNTSTWLADQARFGKEEDARSIGDSTRPLLSADDSWALFDGGNRNGNPPAEPPSQASFFNLLVDKDSGSKVVPGRPDHVRNPSDRSESALPLLHHTRRNGSFDSYTADLERENAGQEVVGLPPKISRNPGRLSPSPSGKLDIQGFWNAGEPSTNVSALTSQTASSTLSATGYPNPRLGSTTSSGLLARTQSTLNPDEAREYSTKVCDLLVEFSAGDSVVKLHMCSLHLLIRLFQMLNKLEAPILVKILRCINQLSQEPNTLEPLQRADAIKHLVPFLEQQEGLYVDMIQNEVLSSLHNLCKINKRRQEQAAESGIIPHLMRFILTGSSLKQYALPLLCDMAHASRYTREQLRAYKGLDIYLSLLDDRDWAVTAIDSLAVCLAHDNDQRKVESLLLKPESLVKLVEFFRCCSGNSFVQILEPFLKMITKSVRLNTALAVSGLTPLLVGRLDHNQAIARLLLLKMIKAVYEHHPRPKQLIVEHNLPSRLQKLIEERRDGERSGGQVLVKQVATALLKALHINTVL
jgi:hypothetical protein